MEYKGSYKGLEDVSKSVVESRVKKIILILLFLTIFISSMYIVTSRVENKLVLNNKNDLNVNENIYSIENAFLKRDNMGNIEGINSFEKALKFLNIDDIQ